MISHRTKWFRDRLYEIYLSIAWKSFYFAVVIADIDFEIHLVNCRGLKNE